MTDTEVYLALSARMGDSVGSVPVIHAGRTAGEQSVTHIRIDRIGEVEQGRSIQDSGFTDKVGVYQASVFVKQNDGDAAALRVVDAIKAKFTRGQVAEGLRIEQEPIQGPAFNADGWRIIPLTINYRVLQ